MLHRSVISLLSGNQAAQTLSGGNPPKINPLIRLLATERIFHGIRRDPVCALNSPWHTMLVSPPPSGQHLVRTRYERPSMNSGNPVTDLHRKR